MIITLRDVHPIQADRILQELRVRFPELRIDLDVDPDSRPVSPRIEPKPAGYFGLAVSLARATWPTEGKD